MARLSIRKVIYRGEKWFFESSLLGDGLQILVGRNGAGKSTFSSLIYFGLGGRVTSFEREDREPHREITSDEKNHVHLTIEIDDVEYSLKRFFNSNEVGIEQPNGDIEVLSVTRSKNVKRVFSDWMLAKLGIDPVMLHYGAYEGKVNLADVFRLIYHDQSPDPSGIFKKVDRESFVTDSVVFRKAIFELLIGKSFQQYYSAAASLKRLETDWNVALQTLDQFKQFVDDVSDASGDDANVAFINAQITETRDQLQRALQFRSSLQEAEPASPDNGIEARKVRLYELTLRLSDLKAQANQVSIELARFRQLQADMILEATQIKKMMFAHDSLDLFLANTCPYCLNEVERVEGKCVCGADVDEAAYERFFYDNADYLAILKTKQKNVQTIQAAIESSEAELRRLNGRIAQSEGDSDAERLELRQAAQNSTLAFDPNALRETDTNILNLRSEIGTLEQKLSLEKKRQEIEDRCSSLASDVSRAKGKARELEGQAQQEMERKRVEFGKQYTELLASTVAAVRTTSIDDAYMPVINQGEYREASASVPKRLMYYLTLLSLSLEDPEMAFPRFLLIDTPQTAGIDRPALQLCIDRIQEILDGSENKGQVILTIGDDRLTPSQDESVFLTIEDADHLLQPRTPAVS